MLCVNVLGETPGLLPGEFSVSPTRKVRFSMGNLQYHVAGTHLTADGKTIKGEWQFTPYQYHLVDRTNNNYRDSRWFDLFSWATSGYAINNTYAGRAHHPDEYGTYGPTGTALGCGLVGANVYYDSGVYNAILNGGNRPGLWRMLTKKEMIYLIYERPNAARLMGRGRVGSDDKGMILLPDDWQCPPGITFVPKTNNVYTIQQWNLMEQAGAVFLPGTGTGNPTYRSDISWGEYDLSTAADTNDEFGWAIGSRMTSSTVPNTQKYVLDFLTGYNSYGDNSNPYVSEVISTRITCKGDMYRARCHALRVVQDVSDQPIALAYDIQGTSIVAPTTAGLKSVDLGLSVRWSNLDLGSSQWESVGDKYQWGATTPNATNTYYNSVASTYTKYNETDHKHLLDPADDAARQGWGAAWRMPTVAEVNELLDSCKMVPAIINNKFVWRAIPFSGTSCIYLPGDATFGNANHAYYWTNSLSLTAFLWTDSIFSFTSPPTANPRAFLLYIQSTQGKPAYNNSTYSRTSFAHIRGVTNDVVDEPDVMPTVVTHTVTVHYGNKTEQIVVPHGANLALYAYSIEPDCQQVTGWDDGVTMPGRTLTNITADQTLTVTYTTTPITVTVEPDNPAAGSCAVSAIP